MAAGKEAATATRPSARWARPTSSPVVSRIVGSTNYCVVGEAHAVAPIIRVCRNSAIWQDTDPGSRLTAPTNRSLFARTDRAGGRARRRRIEPGWTHRPRTRTSRGVGHSSSRLRSLVSAPKSRLGRGAALPCPTPAAALITLSPSQPGRPPTSRPTQPRHLPAPTLFSSSGPRAKC